MNQSVASISEFIFRETPVSKADIILIPGGRRRQLMERAAGLYQRGLAPILLPSGGINPSLPGLTEWQYLRNIGSSLGLPDRALLREDKARHTLENAELSWKVIVQAGLQINAAIIVCKAFHARRAHMAYSAVFPEHIRFMVSPVHDDRDIRKDNWYTNNVGIGKVLGELERIGRHFGPHINQMAEAQF